MRTRWHDPAIAVFWLIALEIENFTVTHHRAPVAVDALLVAAIALAAVWRRRAPLAFVMFVLACTAGLVASWSSNNVAVAPLYVLVVLPYTAARELPRAPAAIGLATVTTWGLAVNAATSPSVGNFLGTAATTCAAWGAGRWLTARQLLNDELKRNRDRIEAERESRVRLAVADERTRIARELHTLVAANVSAMVIQAEAAELLLDSDLDAAEEAMAAVEETGRDALTDMRRVLGVLRHADDSPSLAPQPGVGQIYALVESSRGQGRAIELSVDGEPGPLPASVDLGIYRVLEEALRGSADGMEVQLRFGRDDIELEVNAGRLQPPVRWPTLAMTERVAICDGVIDGTDGRLLVTMPRELEGAFA